MNFIRFQSEVYDYILFIKSISSVTFTMQLSLTNGEKVYNGEVNAYEDQVNAYFRI